MSERWGLRARFAMFFIAIAGAGSVALAAGLYLGWRRSGGAIDGYVLGALVGVVGLTGVTAWVAMLFDENVARPILGLASDLNTRAKADVHVEIDQKQARYLGALAPAANSVHVALAKKREETETMIAEETARLNAEKALFEVLLRDLAEGVVVMTPDRRVMLYNREAMGLLGDIGLGRAMSAYMRPEPIDHALDRLRARQDRGDEEAESFLTASADGARMLLSRISPVMDEDTPMGYVLIFHDATDDLKVHAERDHLFNETLERVRRPTAALRAVLDIMNAEPDMPDDQRAEFRSMARSEVTHLTETLSVMGARHEEATTKHWPTSSVASTDVFDGLMARHPDTFKVVGSEKLVSCDGFAVMELLDSVVTGLLEDSAREDFTLRAEPRGNEVWLTLCWVGDEAPDGQIDEWLKRPLSVGYGDYSARDALNGHKTEIWPEARGERHCVALPLPAIDKPIQNSLSARPEFYDFTLGKTTVAPDMADRKLRDLTYVVFDTETTGLTPRQGDEIVQIAGLRIVNSRILQGEAFDTLVDPQRSIPAASTAVHHIDQSMVEGAPKIAQAGLDFHRFTEDAVLVAHNAPFDMTFLKLKEDTIGAKFDQPVLCTVLLSAFLFDHTGQHTLDALAERFGITIPEHLRHTAMGDTQATAEVFLQMLQLLEGAGIETLGQANEAANQMAQIRKMQNY